MRKISKMTGKTGQGTSKIYKFINFNNFVFLCQNNNIFPIIIYRYHCLWNKRNFIMIK